MRGLGKQSPPPPLARFVRGMHQTGPVAPDPLAFAIHALRIAIYLNYTELTKGSLMKILNIVGDENSNEIHNKITSVSGVPDAFKESLVRSPLALPRPKGARVLPY